MTRDIEPAVSFGYGVIDAGRLRWHCKGDLILLGVAVLGNQVAERVSMMSATSRCAPLPSSIIGVDVNKMIGRPLASIRTGLHGLVDDRQKIAPTGITQQILQLARQPELHLVLVVDVILEAPVTECPK